MFIGRTPDRHHLRLVIAAMTAFVIFFSITAWSRHLNFHTSQYDLGNMDQVMWQTLHGQPFMMMSPNQARFEPRTAIHADWLLLGYLPAYVLWPDPRVMMLLQVLVVASGALPIYFLARRVGGSRVGVIGATMYLLYPPLLWSLIFDVHAIVLATPLLLWAIWGLREKRWGWYWVCLALALLSKEEVGLVVAGLGLYAMFVAKQRRLGLLTMLIGLSWSALMIGWAIPHARHAPGHFALEYFSDFGSTPGSVVTGILTKPEVIVHKLLTENALKYITMLLWPVAFVALLGWRVLLIAVPAVAINLLSNNPALRSIFYHYISAVTPFVLVAAIDSWPRVTGWLKGRHWPIRPAVLALAAIAAAGVWFWAPLPGTHHHRDAVAVFPRSPYRADVATIVRQLGQTERVAITNNLGPHFTQRREVWAFPIALDRAEAAVVLLGGEHEVVSTVEMSRAVERLTTNPEWELVHHHDALWYFLRRPM